MESINTNKTSKHSTDVSKIDEKRCKQTLGGGGLGDGAYSFPIELNTNFFTF